jgi:hypothetical protein
VEEVDWEASQTLASQSQSNPRQGTPLTPHSEERIHSKYSERETNQIGQPFTCQLSCSGDNSGSQESAQPLKGIGQQGGRIFVEGGGGLKTKTKASPKTSCLQSSQRALNKACISSLELPNPLTIMSVEIQVQCRTGRAGINDSKEIAMRPNADKDKVSAIVYVYAKDPGGGETMQILERGCIFVPFDAELKGSPLDKDQARRFSSRMEASLPRATLGLRSKLTVEAVRDEKQLMLRLSSIVRWKDPDMLLSWDPQSSGLGYIIERGAILGKSVDSSRHSPQTSCSVEIDMVRLLGRLPTMRNDIADGVTSFLHGKKPEVDHKETRKSSGEKEVTDISTQWKGSGLGAEWDERIGPGVAAASIVSFSNYLCRRSEQGN